MFGCYFACLVVVQPLVQLSGSVLSSRPVVFCPCSVVDFAEVLFVVSAMSAVDAVLERLNLALYPSCGQVLIVFVLIEKPSDLDYKT